MTILFTIGWLTFNQPGCPIRKSPDITPAYGSPRLIAVNHVLHRLSVPRHSPCALYSLTFLCDPLNDLSYSLVDNCIINNYPFLKNIVTISKTDVTMSYLSFVLHTLFSFQGAISEFSWIQISILSFLNTEIWSQFLFSDFLKFWFYLQQGGTYKRYQRSYK